MSQQIIQGYCSDTSYQQNFDNEGHAYRLWTSTIDQVVFTFKTYDNPDFSPSDGDYLVASYNPQTAFADAVYMPYPSIGFGKGWKALKQYVKDEKLFYHYMTGVVKHKEKIHQNDDISKDGYSGGYYFKVVLKNEAYFTLQERDGKHVSAGDTVEKIKSSTHDYGVFHNLTTGYVTGPSIIEKILLYGLSLGFIIVIVMLLQSTKEWDGGKISFICILAAIPTLYLGSRYTQIVRTPRMLKLMARLRNG